MRRPPLLALLFVHAAPLAAQTAPTAAARVVTTAPVIDGRLNDPVWQEATPITGFIQRELHEGDKITERTEVRIITDGEALYVAAYLYDREPSGIVPGRTAPKSPPAGCGPGTADHAAPVPPPPPVGARAGR